LSGFPSASNMAAKPEEQEPLTGDSPKEPTPFPIAACLCGCVCCVVILLGVVWMFLVNYMTGMAVGEFLTINDEWVMEFCESDLDMSNITGNIWWPGCGLVTKMSEINSSCSEPCYNASILEDMNDFNNANPGSIVRYPSRSMDEERVKEVQLGGWLLPAAKNHEKAPRIVIQHGFTANSNKFRTMLAAYMLRKLGYNVLVTNFRNHCYSDQAEPHMYEWGHAYPYDLLGAWDYMVMDPEKKMGGEVPPSKVGLMGFSKGAFIVLNALGLEAFVPAAWVDSPPYTPEIVFAHGGKKKMEEMGIGFLAPVLLGPAWQGTEKEALSHGIDMNDNLPQEVLPEGPDEKRPLYWVGNKNDDTVPIGEGQLLKELVGKYPQKYDFTSWQTDGDCHQSSHCMDHLLYFDKYTKNLCKFWSAAFGQNASCAD